MFVASDYKPLPGGIAAYIDDLARGLISLGCEATVLAVVEGGDDERVEFLRQYEEWVIPFELIYDKRPKSWLGNKCVSLLEIGRCVSPTARRVLERTSLFEGSVKALSKLERILVPARPTMIVFGSLDIRLYPFALFLRAHGIPYGIIAHDVEVYRSPDKRNDLVRRGLMLEGAGWIAANSHHTKLLLEAWGMSDKTEIVHPPIAEEAIKESCRLGPIPTTKGALKLVTVCRLVKGKGIDIVLHALKILAADGVPYQYVICGDGSERKYLESLVDELGLRDRVQFEGYITDERKWHLLRTSDVFVMPSRVSPGNSHEGFGIAFVEAAAFGLPGVGSVGGGIPDAVVDGETGILVPQESPERLAEALSFLYRSPAKRQEMGRVGAERARREFSPGAIAARFQEVISRGMTKL